VSEDMIPKTVAPESGYEDIARERAATAEAALADALTFAHAQEESLARLASVHREAVETARLANLLGRTPYAAALLVVGGVCVSAALYGTVPLAPLVIWNLFLIAGAVALTRLYRLTARSAFELLPLRAFALDLNAVLLYAGFAWGAGAFLALPQSVPGVALTLYAAGAAALAACIFRSRNAALTFLIPASGLPFIAALGSAGGLGPAGAILLFGIAIAATSELAERLAARRSGTPALPLFSAA